MTEKMKNEIFSALWEIERIFTDLYGNAAVKCQQGIGLVVKIKEIINDGYSD